MSNYGAIINKNTNKKGVLCLNEVSDAYVVKTPALWSGTAGTSIDLGEVSESDPNQSVSETDVQNESGVTVFSDETYQGGTVATLMERDKVKIDFLADWVKGKFYLEYKYCGIVDGKHQEHFQIVKVPAQYSLKLPGGAAVIKYGSKRMWPNTTITITSTSLAAIETALSITIYCTGVSITNTKGYCIKETAVT
jgi:hypothetical protein